MWSSKDVYYISDSTGIMITNLGQALICQFPETNFNEEKFPFIKTVKDAKKTLAYILKRSGGRRPLVFCTIIDPEVREIFDSPEVEYFDAFGGFLNRLESCIEAKALREPGYSRHHDNVAMTRRVEAINFSLMHDDGSKQLEYDEADVILLGVSRTGKTPICVYLATQMGLKSANFPLTTEYLSTYRVPDEIRQNLARVVGLTTAPERLHRIREIRYAGSKYAMLSTCIEEIEQAQEIFQKNKIPAISTDGKSIEETATQVQQMLGISKKALFPI